MKQETLEIKVIKADEGKVLYKKDSDGIYGETIYLAAKDSPENYEEITIEEAEKRVKEAEEKAKAEAEGE